MAGRVAPGMYVQIGCQWSSELNQTLKLALRLFWLYDHFSRTVNSMYIKTRQLVAYSDIFFKKVPLILKHNFFLQRLISCILYLLE